MTLTILMGLARLRVLLCSVLHGRSHPVRRADCVLVRLMIPACFINSVNTVQFAIITRRLEFRRLSLLDMTITLVGAAVSIPLAVIGLNGEAMVLGVLAGSLAGFILICCWVLPPIPNFRLRAARDLLRSGIPAASAAASLVGFQNCDYVIVGARLGALQAGYYFRAYTLGVVYQKKVTQVLTSRRLPCPVASHERGRSRPPSPADGSHHHADPSSLSDGAGDRRTQVRHVVLRARMARSRRPGTDIGYRWWRHAGRGGGHRRDARDRPSSSRDVVGMGAFPRLRRCRFRRRPLRSTAVAVAAVVVHTTFLVISYLQLAAASPPRRSRRSPRTFFPPQPAPSGSLAVALPVSVFASTLGIPVVPYLLIIAVAGGAGYFLSLRLWFPNELRHLGLLAGRLLPVRAHRLFGRFIVRPQPQSAA